MIIKQSATVTTRACPEVEAWSEGSAGPEVDDCPELQKFHYIP